MVKFPETGKIQNDFLNEIILPNLGAKRQELIVGPAFGVDVAVIRLPNGLALASTSDPLSLIPTLGLKESAWLSVHLMASDIATTGCHPMYAAFNLILPPSLEANDFQEYWKYISAFCEEIGVAITGGHTGRFEGQNSTVSGGGTMFTIAPEEEILTCKGAVPGNDLIVTKEAAIVSTSILVRSFPGKVKKELGEKVFDQARDLFFYSSGVIDALTAVKAGKGANGVTAMHDVTEGGVLGAIVELTAASGCGVEINKDKLPVGEAQSLICELFGIDPMFSIGAGSVIIACNPAVTGEVIRHLGNENIHAVKVGSLMEATKGMYMLKNGKKARLEHPGSDPYWEAFYKAFKLGWK